MSISYWIYTDNNEWVEDKNNSIVSIVRFKQDDGTTSKTINLESLNKIFNREGSNKWIRKIETFTIPKDLEYSYIMFSFSVRRNCNSCYITELKLEDGDKATDWTPAPEDVDEKIDETNNNIDIKINNLQIGGRNYILDSEKNVQIVKPSSDFNQYNWTNVHPLKLKKLNKDITYTLSFNFIPQSEGYRPFNSLVVGAKKDSDSWSYRLLITSSLWKIKNYGEYFKYSYTFTIPGDEDSYLQSFVKAIAESNNGDNFSVGGIISHIKLEDGDKATDWTPAPEDIDAVIAKTVKQVDVEYYLSTSSSECSGGSWKTIADPWENGKYMWSRQKVTYVDNTTATRNQTCIAGATGATGTTGTGIESIIEEYYLSTSKTTQKGGSWVTTPPTWESGKYIWTRSKIIYKNPSSTVYTTPLCSSEWEAINNLQIGGRNYIRNGKGDFKKGFFSQATITEEGGEFDFNRLTIEQSSYCDISIPIKDHIVINPREFIPGKKIIISYDIKYTLWNLGENATIGECWFGIRYGSPSWKPISLIKMPQVGVNGYELNTWKHCVDIMTIPSIENDDVPIESKIRIQIKNDIGHIKAILKNVKLEYGEKATDWTPAPEDINDNLEIGGRNLLLETRTQDRNKGNYQSSVIKTDEKLFSCNIFKSSEAWADIGFDLSRVILDNGLKVGDKLTYSIWNKTDENVKRMIYLYTTTNKLVTLASNFKTSTEWQKLKYTFVITSEMINNIDTPSPTRFECASSNSDGTYQYWAAPKLEYGDKATDWTPAPEDIESDILDLNDIISTSRYILLTSQPTDWATNYTDYYEIIDNHYVKITGDTSPTWVENTYYKLEEALINRIRTAEQTIDSIHGIITSMVIGADGDYISTNNDGGSFTMNFGNLISKVKELVGQSNNYADKDIINEILYGNDTSEGLIDKVAENANKTAYIKAEKIDGYPVITLGADESPFKVQITNTSIDFLENNQKIAFANGQAFYNLKTVVQQDVRIGGTYNETTGQVEGYGFIWKTRENGNLGLMWIDTTPTNIL